MGQNNSSSPPSAPPGGYNSTGVPGNNAVAAANDRGRQSTAEEIPRFPPGAADGSGESFQSGPSGGSSDSGGLRGRPRPSPINTNVSAFSPGTAANRTSPIYRNADDDDFSRQQRQRGPRPHAPSAESDDDDGEGSITDADTTAEGEKKLPKLTAAELARRGSVRAGAGDNPIDGRSAISDLSFLDELKSEGGYSTTGGAGGAGGGPPSTRSSFSRRPPRKSLSSGAGAAAAAAGGTPGVSAREEAAAKELVRASQELREVSASVRGLLRSVPRSLTEEERRALFELFDSLPHEIISGGTGSGAAAGVENVRRRVADLWFSAVRNPEFEDKFTGEFEKLAHSIQGALFAATNVRLQARSLMNMFTVAIKVLDDDSSLQSLLRSLGARHGMYGVDHKQFTYMGSALTRSLQLTLREDFTHELQQEWGRVYNHIATTMVKALKEHSVSMHQATLYKRKAVELYLGNFRKQVARAVAEVRSANNPQQQQHGVSPRSAALTPRTRPAGGASLTTHPMQQQQRGAAGRSRTPTTTASNANSRDFTAASSNQPLTTVTEGAVMLCQEWLRRVHFVKLHQHQHRHSTTSSNSSIRPRDSRHPSILSADGTNPSQFFISGGTVDMNGSSLGGSVTVPATAPAVSAPVGALATAFTAAAEALARFLTESVDEALTAVDSTPLVTGAASCAPAVMRWALLAANRSIPSLSNAEIAKAIGSSLLEVMADAARHFPGRTRRNYQSRNHQHNHSSQQSNSYHAAHRHSSSGYAAATDPSRSHNGAESETTLSMQEGDDDEASHMATSVPFSSASGGDGDAGQQGGDTSSAGDALADARNNAPEGPAVGSPHGGLVLLDQNVSWVETHLQQGLLMGMEALQQRHPHAPLSVPFAAVVVRYESLSELCVGNSADVVSGALARIRSLVKRCAARTCCYVVPDLTDLARLAGSAAAAAASSAEAPTTVAEDGDGEETTAVVSSRGFLSASGGSNLSRSTQRFTSPVGKSSSTDKDTSSPSSNTSPTTATTNNTKIGDAFANRSPRSGETSGGSGGVVTARRVPSTPTTTTGTTTTGTTTAVEERLCDPRELMPTWATGAAEGVDCIVVASHASSALNFALLLHEGLQQLPPRRMLNLNGVPIGGSSSVASFRKDLPRVATAIAWFEDENKSASSGSHSSGGGSVLYPGAATSGGWASSSGAGAANSSRTHYACSSRGRHPEGAAEVVSIMSLLEPLRYCGSGINALCAASQDARGGQVLITGTAARRLDMELTMPLGPIAAPTTSSRDALGRPAPPAPVPDSAAYCVQALPREQLQEVVALQQDSGQVRMSLLMEMKFVEMTAFADRKFGLMSIQGPAPFGPKRGANGQGSFEASDPNGVVYLDE